MVVSLNASFFPQIRQDDPSAAGCADPSTRDPGESSSGESDHRLQHQARPDEARTLQRGCSDRRQIGKVEEVRNFYNIPKPRLCSFKPVIALGS